ncbi:hypothetical protein ATCC90586_000457 [Pythium insidiosum]|nr:hypothetical protein ATCC90586_000457 [Pythium insidiosum]
MTLWPDAPADAQPAPRWSLRRWSLLGASPSPPLSSSSSCTSPPEPQAPVKMKRVRCHSVDVHTPMPSSLKKAAPAHPFIDKMAHYMEALRLHSSQEQGNNGSSLDHHRHHRHCHHRRSHHAQDRHVHFPSTADALSQEIERPETTDDEKLLYHYSKQELNDMAVEAKEALQFEARSSAQSEDTIYEQGYLVFPTHHHFFHHKRYYCLLRRRRIECYATPQHAANGSAPRRALAFIKVQDCAAMSMQAKIAAFGAHLPSTLAQLFFVTLNTGERVLLSAECRSAKKHWVHILQRLTQVHEMLPLPTLTCRQTSASSTSTCTSEDESDDDHHDAQANNDDAERPRSVSAPPCAAIDAAKDIVVSLPHTAVPIM